MMQFKEVNGKDIIDDLFTARDKQLEEDAKIKNEKQESQQSQKPKKERKPRTPKKKN
jgi:hypothetical protein